MPQRSSSLEDDGEMDAQENRAAAAPLPSVQTDAPCQDNPPSARLQHFGGTEGEPPAAPIGPIRSVPHGSSCASTAVACRLPWANDAGKMRLISYLMLVVPHVTYAIAAVESRPWRPRELPHAFPAAHPRGRMLGAMVDAAGGALMDRVPLLLVRGGQGSGKTAFAAELVSQMVCLSSVPHACACLPTSRPGG